MTTLQELGISEEDLAYFNNLLQTNPEKARRHWLVAGSPSNELTSSRPPARR